MKRFTVLLITFFGIVTQAATLPTKRVRVQCTSADGFNVDLDFESDFAFIQAYDDVNMYRFKGEGERYEWWNMTLTSTFGNVRLTYFPENRANGFQVELPAWEKISTAPIATSGQGPEKQDLACTVQAEH